MRAWTVKESEIEAALRLLGWELEGPKRTPSGWKAAIRRPNAAVLTTGRSAEQVLEDLLEAARKCTEQS
jgi:hypothetical protein